MSFLRPSSRVRRPLLKPLRTIYGAAHQVRLVRTRYGAAHQVRSRAASAAGAHQVRSRAASAAGAHQVRSRAASAAGAHQVRSRAPGTAGAHQVRSRAPGTAGAHQVRSRAPGTEPRTRCGWCADTYLVRSGVGTERWARPDHLARAAAPRTGCGTSHPPGLPGHLARAAAPRTRRAPGPPRTRQGARTTSHQMRNVAPGAAGAQSRTRCESRAKRARRRITRRSRTPYGTTRQVRLVRGHVPGAKRCGYRALGTPGPPRTGCGTSHRLRHLPPAGAPGPPRTGCGTSHPPGRPDHLAPDAECRTRCGRCAVTYPVRKQGQARSTAHHQTISHSVRHHAPDAAGRRTRTWCEAVWVPSTGHARTTSHRPRHLAPAAAPPTRRGARTTSHRCGTSHGLRHPPAGAPGPPRTAAAPRTGCGTHPSGRRDHLPPVGAPDQLAPDVECRTRCGRCAVTYPVRSGSKGARRRITGRSRTPYATTHQMRPVGGHVPGAKRCGYRALDTPGPPRTGCGTSHPSGRPDHLAPDAECRTRCGRCAVTDLVRKQGQGRSTAHHPTIAHAVRHHAPDAAGAPSRTWCESRAKRARRRITRRSRTPYATTHQMRPVRRHVPGAKRAARHGPGS